MSERERLQNARKAAQLRRQVEQLQSQVNRLCANAGVWTDKPSVYGDYWMRWRPVGCRTHYEMLCRVVVGNGGVEVRTMFGEGWQKISEIGCDVQFNGPILPPPVEPAKRKARKR